MLALGAIALGATSCGTAVNLARINAATYTDDLYAIHDTEALREAERQLAEREAAAKAEQEKRIAAMIAAANAEADIDDLLSDVEVVESPAGTVISTDGGDVNVYNNIYVDDYKSAYARRLQGFSSLTYRMPSSYWDYRYGDAYFLTLAYDPAFYTVMIMGDQVWVEPRYITNMFGSWNNPYYYGYHYGYNPYYYGYSYGYWDYWGWNSPYWGCDPFYHYHCHNHWYGPHYGHPHNPPHPPVAGGHKNPNVSHRPSYGMTAGGSTSRPSYREQFGGTTTSRGGATVGSSARPAVSNGRVSENAGTTRGELTKPANKNELSGTLSGTTIKPNASRPTRGGGVSGASNSSSRSSRSAVTSKGSSSSSRSTGVSSSSSSSSRSSSRVSSSSSRSSRSSSVSSSSSSRSSSSSSSSRSSYSSGSSSRNSYSSGGSSSSSSSRSSGSSRSSRR